ncbi:hypothetical protein DL98DRAFT_660375 [Cadophora sp. DSE1049]|nr:hypothetical protein DL98DRAFT_660375 [Cadophora sp. DSE1049]
MAEPVLDPEGFIPGQNIPVACPPRALQPVLALVYRNPTNSDKLAFPRITAPASRRSLTTPPSNPSFEPRSTVEPRVVSVDDVYCSDFVAQGTLVSVHLTQEVPVLDNKVAAYINSSFEGKYLHYRAETNEGWKAGPYFLEGNQLHEAWRLYADELEAFVLATIPVQANPNSFEPLPVMSADGRFTAFAVPSRLYHPVSKEKPLNGMRISVKDNYHLTGTITTLGSRSYADCYGIQNVTSAFVQELVEQGAIMLGRQSYAPLQAQKCHRLAQLITLLHSIQEAMGTTARAAAQTPQEVYISSYKWSLGLRTTWSPSLMTDIVTGVQAFDTVGLVSRSAEALLKTLPVTNQKKWSETAPGEHRGTPLPDYLRKTGRMITMWWGYHNFEEDRELHQKKFNKPPYVSPCQKWKWNDGASVTMEQRLAAEKEIEVFKAWISEHIIKDDSSTIMMIPSGSSKPYYRDEGYPNPTYSSKPGGSYNGIFFATILGLPHPVAPIGQLPYESKTTQRTEYLPVTAGLVGAANTDEMLIRVARGAVEKIGKPSEVQTGSLAFPLEHVTEANASMPNLGSSL